ncbi:sulfatase-like hydrolase/transferase [Pseudoalteromonas sp. SG44-17]|uniref:sulfatase-like hydrolase/transferase n=1 Tax=Pseudoalteromonas sp. SG44-17 TaxID=2760963 RepID=UPI0016036405|nr:sulfatase-like hydrolase/transferase [Pseudoalteromonas sp. SG44-17]MBB1408591.1 sulfatase-like hydrolase/transferase [Pseudoalteromonas sp. SG44-17]
MKLSSQNLGIESTEKKLSNALSSYPFLYEISLFFIGVSLSIILLGVIAHIASDNLKTLQNKSLSYFTCVLITWCLLFFSILGLSSNLYPSLFFSHSTWNNFILLVITIPALLLLLLSSFITRKNIKTLLLISLTLTTAELNNFKLKKEEKNNTTKRNVFIIGIDSLNINEIDNKKMPFLQSFIDKSNYLPITYTHIARTFPSWITILTGNYPITNKARLNLTDFNQINLKKTLPYYLKAAGYVNYYIQDERRFNNIDERLYFDKIIGPPATAAEFLLSKVVDFPLVTLASELKFFNLFMPHIINNRAAWVTYSTEKFNKKIEQNILNTDSPIFSAAHFTLPHWPYKINKKTDGIDSDYNKYLKTLSIVDEQIESYFAILNGKGLLENALVFIVSDHGESFSRESDIPDNKNPEIINLAGHGTTIISNSQYRTLLSFGHIKNGEVHKFKNVKPMLNYALSDITPTIIDILNLNVTEKFDGMSILKVKEQRSIPLESSLQPMFNSKGTIDIDGTIQQNSYLFEVDSLGKVVVKEELYQRAVISKQRGIIFDKWQISFYPEHDNKIYITDLEKKVLYNDSDFSDIYLKKELIKKLCNHFNSEIITANITPCINSDYVLSNSQKAL